MDNVQVYSMLAQFEAQSLSTEDAYVRLGQEELGVGATPVDLLRAGKRVFDNSIASVRSHICGSEFIKKAATDQNVIDSGTIAALVSSASGAVMWSNINVALVSYIAARIGIRVLCGSIWQEGNS